MSSLNHYDQVLQYLFALDKRGIVLNLNSTKHLLGLLGNPHSQFPSILVAGTNGKGSTVALLTRILLKAGYKVGTYISPHLLDVRERVALNGKPISKNEFLNLVRHLKKINDQFQLNLTFFEFMTGLAFWYFQKKKIDMAVVEVGLGGRLDATNVLKSQVSVITTIGFDHQKFLGNTLSKIAFEKAGIIKEKGILISGVQQPKIQKQLEEAAASKGSTIFQLEKDFFIEGGKVFHYRDSRWIFKDLKLSLLGTYHQRRNAACAIAVSSLLVQSGWTISQKAIREGLASTLWPGRLEILQQKPMVILDGAHNPSGIEVLAKALKKDFNYQKLHVVMGVMADKNYKVMIKKILPLADSFHFVEPVAHRALLGKDLIQKMPFLKQRIYLNKKISSVLPMVISSAQQNDIVCVTGSLYTVSEAKKFFYEKNSSP